MTIQIKIYLVPYIKIKRKSVNQEKLMTEIADLNDRVVDLVKENSIGDIYTMVCFDMTAILKKKISHRII